MVAVVVDTLSLEELAMAVLEVSVLVGIILLLFLKAVQIEMDQMHLMHLVSMEETEDY